MKQLRGFWIAAAVMAGMGAYSAILWLDASSDARRLAQDPVLTEARVVAKDISTTRDKNGSLRETYLVEVEFTDKGGTQHRERAAISPEGFEGVEVGATLTVTYAATEPSLVEVEPGRLGEGSRLAGWTVVIFAALALVFAALALALRGRKRR